MAGNYSQDVQDRAREWVNEHYPNAEGAEWDQRFEEACRDLSEIDARNDRAERATRMAGAVPTLDGVGRYLDVGNQVNGWRADGSTRRGVVESVMPPRQVTVRWSTGETETVDSKKVVNISIGGMSRGGALGSARAMASDCTGAELAIGDRVSIDKVGEGTVSAVAGDTVRIRVPGATPEEESFDPKELAFWNVRKLSLAVSLARTSGYVYELEGGANWQSAPDDAWDTVVADVDGRVVGRRSIDGSTVVVIQQGDKVYAVLPQNVTMSGGAGGERLKTMERRRVDLGFGHTYVNDDRPVPEQGSLIAESEDGGQVEYWTYPGRGEWAYQGKRVTVHARSSDTRKFGRESATAMSGNGDELNPYCTGCGRPVTLEPDGSVPVHKDDAHRSTNPGGRCPGSGQKPGYEGQRPTQRFGRGDDALEEEWLDDWVLLTTGQVGLVQTVRGGQLSIDIAAGPLDHIDDAGWHTVLVPPSMVRRKLNWDEIQRLRTPDGWTSGHTPRLSGSTSGARTFGYHPGRPPQPDTTVSSVRAAREYLFDEDDQDGRSVTVDLGDGRSFTGTVREVRQELTFQIRDQDAPRRISIRFMSRRDLRGSPATLARSAIAVWNEQAGRLVRRYSVSSTPWLLVEVEPGRRFSWPAAEARVITHSAWSDLARRHGALSIDEAGPWSGAKFATKDAADAFAEDVQAGIGRRPQVEPSPLDARKWWAQLKLSVSMTAAATTMAQAVDAYGAPLKVGDRVVHTSDGGRGTITSIGTNTDDQPSLEVKWDDGSEHGVAAAWVQRQTMARTAMASEIGAREDAVQVGDQAKVFYDGVECEGVVTTKPTSGVIGVSLTKSGRLQLPTGTSVGVSTTDIVGVWRSGRQVF